MAKPLIKSFWDKNRAAHDQPILNILLNPKMKIEHWSGGIGTGVPSYSKTEELPYSIVELTEKSNRSTDSIQASIGRLEKRGKIAERSGGWQRKV